MKESRIDKEARAVVGRLNRAMDALYRTTVIPESQKFPLANAAEQLRDKTADAYGTELGKAAARRYRYGGSR